MVIFTHGNYSSMVEYSSKAISTEMTILEKKHYLPSIRSFGIEELTSAAKLTLCSRSFHARTAGLIDSMRMLSILLVHISPRMRQSIPRVHLCDGILCERG